MWLLWSAGSCASPADEIPSRDSGASPLDAQVDVPLAGEDVRGDAPSCQQVAGNIWAAWPMPDPTTRDGGVSQSYDASSGDVVIDGVTRLTWERKVDPGSHSWDEAQAYCACLALGGYQDWRLPTRIELVSIVDFTKTDPALDGVAFPATSGDYFWTSSLLAENPSTAWYVYFFDGNTHSGGMDSAYRVRCVRSEATATPTERYTIAGDGTVFDKVTKLTWQRTLDMATRSWSEANAYCAGLMLAGPGWRLPNMKELQTLVDERATSPAIAGAAFPGTPSEAFWTSSPLVGGPAEAWFVNFYSGVSYTNVLENPYRARCVR